MKIVDQRAMTLSEILVVVIIVGIMASLVLPRYPIVVERTRITEGVQILTALLGAQRRFALENSGAFQDGTGGGNALAPGDLDIDIPASLNFNIPLIFNNPAGVATINRTGGAYSFSIDSQGNLTCVDGGSGLCQKMGH